MGLLRPPSLGGRPSRPPGISQYPHRLLQVSDTTATISHTNGMPRKVRPTNGLPFAAIGLLYNGQPHITLEYANSSSSVQLYLVYSHRIHETEYIKLGMARKSGYHIALSSQGNPQQSIASFLFTSCSTKRDGETDGCPHLCCLKSLSASSRASALSSALIIGADYYHFPHLLSRHLYCIQEMIVA